jgi:xanthine dehydrogenase YagR molybdenum-binding subunit
MDITVNGKPVSLEEGTDGPLADLLRDALGLTGTKVACGTGACGACTVLADGVPTLGCLAPVRAGTEIVTVEGLGGDHPVQRAFADRDALQCGYCTPGFVVEAAAFTDRWRAEHGDVEPPRAEIAAALAGHLCRCGAYAGIYAAVAAACAGRYDEGEVVPARVEAMDKITGRAEYATDVRLDGMLDGVIVRSTQAHARVEAVEAAGHVIVDLLAADRIVRYVGQPIAAVAAPTLADARAAAAEVRVRYTPLDGELYSGSARKSAPRSNEAPLGPAKWTGDLRGPSSSSWRGGTAAKRIAAARERGDTRLVTGVFSTSVQSHTPMEPHACVARWDASGDLHLYVSTQAIGMLLDEVAKRWKLARSRIHVTAEHVGGGFGAKAHMGAEVVAAVELARAHGVPVRVVLSRAEELVDGGNRPATRLELAVLADGSGEPAALAIDAHGEGGVSIGSNAAALARYIYGTAPRLLRDYDHLRSLPPAVPFRGPGGPPLVWALEQAVDEMAGRLGEDPVALRRRWDGNPKRRHLYDQVERLPLWTGRGDPGTGRYRRGVGLATTNWLYLLDPGTRVELSVESGTVVARTATQDPGTGARGAMTEIIATGLGIPRDRVRVEIGRSGPVYGPSSVASSGTPSIAPATLDAVRRLREALAGRPLDEAEGLRVEGRRRRDRRGYITPFPIGRLSIGRGLAGAVHVSEVEVDTRLGGIRVTRVWCGITAGRIFAERLARSQCEGGIVQGIGYALFERRHVDPDSGVVLTANLDDYRIPGIADTPEMEFHFHQEGWDHVAGHGVGLAEMSTVGVAASIGNAVYAATGWRPRDLPILPDRVREGLNL